MASPPVTALAEVPSLRAQQDAGRAARESLPRAGLARRAGGPRDPLDILAAQNSRRIPELVPLRVERMAANPFAFYRGTAAIMAADLARDDSTELLVPSCGDAHVANLGFYASRERTLVFDLNDFDETAWAPWEWDVKRLVTSVVVGGRATSRDEDVVTEAARAVVRGYTRSLARLVERSPLERFYEHFDAGAAADGRNLDADSQAALRAAIADAGRRTGQRAVRRLTRRDEDGDGHALVLQAKEAGRSVLEEYGGVEQPPLFGELVGERGHGFRVVSGQRVLQAVSDPFLGYLRHDGTDYYVRQFHDHKGSIDVEPLTDRPFVVYAEACGVVLARAHSQAPGAGRIVGYVGGGRRVTEAILDWSLAYADVSRADYDAFVAAR